MRLFIPELGTNLKLSKDWTFSLFFEYRNYGIWEAFDSSLKNALTTWRESEMQRLEKLVEEEDEKYFKENPDVIMRFGYTNPYRWEMRNISFYVTLPAETVLRVDRIYIRKGAEDYSSVSFNVISCPLEHLTPAKEGGSFPKYQKRRFWAKLDDVNKIEFS